MSNNIEKYKFICDKCNYKCKFECEWKKHCATGLHMNGERKTRSDLKEPFKCDKCDYNTKNLTTLKQHKLNEHSTLDERKKTFTFYCELCDFETFSKDIFKNHNETDKHKRRETYKNK